MTTPSGYDDEFNLLDVANDGAITQAAVTQPLVSNNDDVSHITNEISSGECACSIENFLKNWLPISVRNLLYWKCPITSAATLSFILLIQISLLFYSVISVLAYTGLSIMIFSLGIKVYAHFVAPQEDSCIKKFADGNWSLSKDHLEASSKILSDKIDRHSVCLRDLFLIRSYSESLKFGLILYLLTYIGAWFNFLTLSIIVSIVAFGFPKFHEIYKNEINQVCHMIRQASKQYISLAKQKLEELPVIGPKLKQN